MWVPGIKIGEGKWLIFGAQDRSRFLKMIENAVVCNEVKGADDKTKLFFATEKKEANNEIINGITRWFSVYDELRDQQAITEAKIRKEYATATAGIDGMVRGIPGGSGGHGVSH